MQMSHIGKKLRLGRIFDNQTNRTVIAAMDHGLFMGPVKGLENVSLTARKAVEGGANAVIVSPGALRQVADEVRGKAGVIMRIDGAVTMYGPDFFSTRRIAFVKNAVRSGADAVIAMGYIGAARESETLENLSQIAQECEEVGMPLLAEMIPVQGEKIKDPYGADAVGLAARVGAEIGADIIKTHYTGQESTFREVVRGCSVPIIIAGGPKMKTEEQALAVVREAMRGGAAGVAFGRNIWQSQNPEGIVRAIVEIVHGKKGFGKEDKPIPKRKSSL